MIRLSIFDNVTDRRPEMSEPTAWSDFIEGMREQAAVVSEAGGLGKATAPCISPAIYPAGSNRAKSSVVGWDWFSADIDNKSGNRAGATIQEVADLMDAIGTPFIIYTTASHRPEAQCFRLMFPLDRMITAAEFDSVWRSFAQKFGCFDEQTKDISRLFIVPRSWTGRENHFVARAEGEPVCVNDIVAAHPVRMASEISPILLAIARDKAHCVQPAYGLHDIDSSPIISRSAVEAALSGQPGGRLYRFLCSVACAARRKDHALDEFDLRQIGMQMAARMGRRDNADVAHDARNALRYADRKMFEDEAKRFGRLQAALTGRKY
jgi:hypothetical protein